MRLVFDNTYVFLTLKVLSALSLSLRANITSPLCVSLDVSLNSS